MAWNQERHPEWTFFQLDVTRAVPPKADLIFCKDLLNHLTYADVRSVIANMKASGSAWLLASNNFGESNVELPSGFGGESRHLDIVAPPMDCSPPVWNTHYLELWRLADM